MTPDDLHGYLALFRDSDWRQLTVTVGPDSLHVSRTGHTGAAVSRTPGLPGVAAVAGTSAPTVVRSPSVGLLRLSRQGTAAPAPGEHVPAGSSARRRDRRGPYRAGPQPGRRDGRQPARR